MMTDTKTAAKNLRRELKALGYSARRVSVRVRDLTVDHAVDVTIKSADVDVARVRELALKLAKVDRCEMSGEILGGGNTYVSVTWAHGVIEGVAGDLIDALERGESADWLGWTANPVDGRPGYFTAAPTGTTAFGSRAPVYCFGAAFCARQIAEKAFTA